MVLPLLTLPPELQALFVVLLVDETTAGRLAQGSRACKQLVQQHLIEFQEERRLAAEARKAAKRQQRRAALFDLFEEADGGAFYTCKVHAVAGGTPCGRQLRIARQNLKVSTLMLAHLARYHVAEYTALKILLEQL